MTLCFVCQRSIAKGTWCAECLIHVQRRQRILAYIVEIEGAIRASPSEVKPNEIKAPKNLER